MDKKMYLGIGSDYMLHSDGDELKKMMWKGPIFLSIRVCSHRITWASSVKGPEQNILLMFIFCQNGCKIILLVSILSVLFCVVNVKGHFPGGGSIFSA